MRLPFLEDVSPPPFYQDKLSQAKRKQLDQWFIGHRSQSYYLKRFERFDQVGRLHAQWNWAAFFMTFGWLLYRKRYLDCVVYCVAGWSFIKVNIVLGLVLAEFLFMDFLPEAWRLWARVALGATIWLFWACMVARWANAYYYRMARREIADALQLGDDEQQKAKLRQEGGVSLVGLSAAFAIFIAMLLVISVQFVPIIAKQKEQEILFEVYSHTQAIAQRTEVIIQKTGSCPVHLPVTSDHHRNQIIITDRVDGVKTDCAVVTTIKQAYYPVRYLNGRNLVMYRSLNEKGHVVWRCQSSLNKKRTPKRCVG